MNVLTSVKTAIQTYDLLPEDGLIVAAVSGGTDSLALLHVLRDLGIRLHVATLDHGLRGAAGAADARFVAETARAWGLPVTVGYVDVPMLAAERRHSIEAAARVARYDFLASVARQVGASRIAVAHNADDQVETVLLHLLRGAGIGGLAGMGYAASLPGHPNLMLIRPLLDVPRVELDTYCREQGLQPRHDASNDDARYARNRLRLDLIPHLRELSPQVERRLLQLAEIAALEDDFADHALHAAVDPHISRSEGYISLPDSVFRQLHPALQRRFVVWAVESLGEVDNVGYVHIDAAVKLAARAAVGARAQLKRGVQLRVDYNAIVVEHEDAPVRDDLPLLAEGSAIPVTVPGVTPINADWTLIASLSPFEGADLRLAVLEGSTVVLRGRQSGDRIAPLGLDGHRQKVGKRMIDQAVPRNVRERLPLLVIDGIVAAIWWNGWTVSEEFVVNEHSERVLYVGFGRDSDAPPESS